MWPTENGALYLRARYYDPSTAHFISRDPATATTRQPYQYVADSPLNHTDPNGLWWFGTTGSASGFFGLLAGIAQTMGMGTAFLSGEGLRAVDYETTASVAGGTAELHPLGLRLCRCREPATRAAGWDRRERWRRRRAVFDQRTRPRRVRRCVQHLRIQHAVGDSDLRDRPQSIRLVSGCLVSRVRMLAIHRRLRDSIRHQYRIPGSRMKLAAARLRPALVIAMVLTILNCGPTTTTRVLYLQESDSGRSVDVKVGDNVQLQLLANRSPWLVSSSDVKVIDYKQEGQVVYSSEHKYQLVFLQAISSGSSTVTVCPLHHCGSDRLTYAFRASG